MVELLHFILSFIIVSLMVVFNVAMGFLIQNFLRRRRRMGLYEEINQPGYWGKPEVCDPPIILVNLQCEWCGEFLKKNQSGIYHCPHCELRPEEDDK